MRSLLHALVIAAAVAAPLAAADYNPAKRCKNHFILRQSSACDPVHRPSWSTAAPPKASHGAHTATLLQDGRVLVAGDTGVAAMSAEIYDPVADAWTLTAPMARERREHTATRLADGRVLVVGGELARHAMDFFPFEGSAEIFDPRTAEWSAAASLATPRGGFTATLLPTGEVLVVGGLDVNDSSLSSAELFDPATGRWKPAASLQVARFWHTATALPDGNVLVVGGWYDDWLQFKVREAELYDWRAGQWLPAGELTGRAGHSATLLDDGSVIVAGGYTSGSLASGSRTFDTLDTSVIFDPQKRAWRDAGDIGTPRYGHLAAAMRGGDAFMVQGTESYQNVPDVRYRDVDAATIYSQAESRWIDLGPPEVAPSASTVTRLADGTLLFVGANRAVLLRY